MIERVGDPTGTQDTATLPLHMHHVPGWKINITTVYSLDEDNMDEIMSEEHIFGHASKCRPIILSEGTSSFTGVSAEFDETKSLLAKVVQ